MWFSWRAVTNEERGNEGALYARDGSKANYFNCQIPAS